MNKRKPKRRSKRKEIKGKKNVRWVNYDLKGGNKKQWQEKEEQQNKKLGLKSLES